MHAPVVAQQDYAAEWGPVCSIAPRTEAPVVREFVDEDGELHYSLELADWGACTPCGWRPRARPGPSRKRRFPGRSTLDASLLVSASRNSCRYRGVSQRPQNVFGVYR